MLVCVCVLESCFIVRLINNKCHLCHPYSYYIRPVIVTLPQPGCKGSGKTQRTTPSCGMLSTNSMSWTCVQDFLLCIVSIFLKMNCEFIYMLPCLPPWLNPQDTSIPGIIIDLLPEILGVFLSYKHFPLMMEKSSFLWETFTKIYSFIETPHYISGNF